MKSGLVEKKTWIKLFVRKISLFSNCDSPKTCVYGNLSADSLFKRLNDEKSELNLEYEKLYN